MTIELKLPPELEVRVKECADAEFAGDVQEMLLEVLKCYFESQQHHPDVETLLMEALDSPKYPMPADWRDLIHSNRKVQS